MQKKLQDLEEAIKSKENQIKLAESELANLEFVKQENRKRETRRSEKTGIVRGVSDEPGPKRPELRSEHEPETTVEIIH